MTNNKTGLNAMIAIATLTTMLLIGFVPSATGQDELKNPESLSLAQLPGAHNSPLQTLIMAPSESAQLQEVATSGGPLKVVDSASWAGYAVTGSSFTSVLGSWIVPAFHCLKTPNSYSVAFVGIDGYSDNTIEAIGTEFDCIGTKYQYYALYQLGTTSTKITGFSVKSGDLISASVSYGPDFTVEIYNITQGLFFSTSAAVSGAQRSSAEWIVERYSNPGYPFMDFGKISSGSDYTNIVDTDWATDSSVSGPISDFGSKMVKLNMVSGGVTYATPTALTTDGSSFIVNWKHE